VNDTTITCNTPAADTLEAPFVDVSVSNALGTSTLPHPFCYATTLLTEDFSSGTLPAWLEDPSATYTISNGSIHGASTGNNTDREYVRTVDADFSTRDFVYMVTLGVGQDYIMFTGIGTGDPDATNFTAPYRAAYLQVHSPNVVSGRVDLVSHDQGNFTDVSNQTMGNDTVANRRVRVIKLGGRTSFEHGWPSTTPFVSNMQLAFGDLATAAPYMTGTTSHLFFGGASPTQTWDDVVVATLRQQAVRLVSVSPTTVSPAGGTTLTITGSGFNGLGGSPVVRLGTTVVSSGINVANDTTLTITTPPHASGDADVVVRGANGAGIILRGLTIQ
jgi:hypothetical protein